MMFGHTGGNVRSLLCEACAGSGSEGRTECQIGGGRETALEMSTVS
jgi:hypothetical protein